MLITINKNKYKVNVDILNNFRGMKLTRDAEKNPLAIIDLLDELIDGGSEYVAESLDPEGKNPTGEEFTTFVVTLLERMAQDKTVKNSSGSQG